MAKMTLSALNAFVKTYVDSTKQAGAFATTTNNLAGLVDKIGKMITIDGSFSDLLPMLDGDTLPFGKTIEEYFVDLTMPSVFAKTSAGKLDYNTEGEKTLAPAFPTFEECSYSRKLDRAKLKTSEPYEDFEMGCLDGTQAANLITKIMERLVQSYSLYKLAVKEQGIANLIDKMGKAANSANLVTAIAKPTDATTGEAFLKQLKEDAEIAFIQNEGHSLGNNLIGGAPELLLIMKQGIKPSLDVDTLAGAFHSEKLDIPAKVVIVDSFGSNTDTYAVLLDPRGFKLHTDTDFTLTQLNADGAYMNHVRHLDFTLFLSKYTYVHCYKNPS